MARVRCEHRRLALALFVSAGTVDWWQAWLYLAVGGVASIPLVRLVTTDPVLRDNRSRAGPAAEQRPVQKLIVACSALPYMAALVVPGLDHRFGWSYAPPWLAIPGNALVVLSLWLVYRVFDENRYGSATVEVAEGQHVVSTGPYAIVRHPMYAGAALYLAGMALALGSWWTLIPAVLTMLALVWRLLDEERFLAGNLPGYTDYCERVRWRLIPGVF